jgi:chemotaxis protein methyltransferase CheR
MTVQARIRALLSVHTGIDASRMPDRALDAAIQRLQSDGDGFPSIEERLANGNSEVLRVLEDAATVGETYFFRHPEQFQIAVNHLRTVHKPNISVWSAGCATGEEAYSLAAVLGQELGVGRRISVLGTDISTGRLAIAREARYREWSLRRAIRLLAPVVRKVGEDYVVHDHIRKDVAFSAHNLLSGPAPGGPFDLVFCRNVLIYLSDDAARTVVKHLTGSLAPDGRLVLGVLDSHSSHTAHLEPVGPPELQMYVPRKATPVEPRRPLRAPIPLDFDDDPITLDPEGPRPEVRKRSSTDAHRSILRAIEREEPAVARSALERLLAQDPMYVPAHLELGLLELRSGRRSAAAAVMGKVVRILENRAADAMLEGPEHAPVAFYRSVAQAVLAQTTGHKK